MKTLQEMAKMALDIQDACNLSGIIHTFSNILPDLRKLLEEECAQKNIPFSTDYLNQHSICVLFSSKIASLTYSDQRFAEAYEWAKFMNPT